MSKPVTLMQAIQEAISKHVAQDARLPLKRPAAAWIEEEVTTFIKETLDRTKSISREAAVEFLNSLQFAAANRDVQETQEEELHGDAEHAPVFGGSLHDSRRAGVSMTSALPLKGACL